MSGDKTTAQLIASWHTFLRNFARERYSSHFWITFALVILFGLFTGKAKLGAFYVCLLWVPVFCLQHLARRWVAAQAVHPQEKVNNA